MVAHVVFEEAAVRLLDVLRQVDEERELRRRRRKLGHILDFDILALGRGGRVVLDQRQHVVVELRGRDAAFARLVDADGGLQHVEDALFVQHRGEDDRNVVERSEFLSEELGPLLHRVAVLLDQVPFVDHDHASLAVADDQVVDVQVLRFESLPGVDHQDADVRIFDGAYRAHHRVEFEVLHRLALLAHAGRVDEVEIHAELVVAGMDRVAGGPGDGGHDVALLAQQGVRERRLADVGTPHDGDVGQVFVLLGGRFHGQCVQNGVHQVARAASRHRRDAVGIAQPQGVELVRGVDLVVVVDLVADEDHLLRGAAQDVGHQHVEVGDAGAYLHEEEDHVGLVDGQQDLTADFVLENILRIDGVPARVDDGKLLAVPVGLAVMAVAGGSGRRVDDGLPFAHEAVEEGAFADVRTAHDCYKAHILSFSYSAVCSVLQLRPP